MTNMEEPRCRICLEEDECVVPSPCACNAHVHVDCLHRWRGVRGLSYCEVCLEATSEEGAAATAVAAATSFPPMHRPVYEYPLTIQRLNVRYPLHIYIGTRLNEDLDWSMELEQG